MFGIAIPGGHRGQTALDWRVKAMVFAGTAALAAAAFGGVLGWLGGMLALETRVVAGAFLTLILLGLGIANLRKPNRLPQRDCETSQAWLERGAFGWAVSNGAALGVGFMSRIGFASWYAVPVACVAFGSPAIGATLMGAYGLTRGSLVWAWILALRRESENQDYVQAVVAWGDPAKRAGALLAIGVATAALIIVGF